MAKEVKKENKRYYVCGECNFAYENKKLAKKCEAWCKKHKSCNIEIAKHAIKI